MPKKKKSKAARPIVALLSDFGMRDWFAASMKGVIKTIAPKADIVDVTHEVEPQDAASASFILENCYRDFPEGTIFCCVVDPGVGTDRRRLAATDGAYFFVAPDNGLLTGVEEASESFLVYAIENKKFMREGFGTTFDGRDVFAPAAAHLAAGTPIDRFGRLCANMTRLEQTHSEFAEGGLRGKIVYVDRFGNLITNIRVEDVGQRLDIRRLIVKIGRKKIVGISQNYAAAKPGEPLAYWGSTGRLEIAVNMGRADELIYNPHDASVLILIK